MNNLIDNWKYLSKDVIKLIKITNKDYFSDLKNIQKLLKIKTI